MSVRASTDRRTRARRVAAPPEAGWRGWLWASAQLALVGLELFGLLLLLASPVFRAKTVEVVGSRHAGDAVVAAALAIPPDRSIFLLSHSDLEAKVRTLPWVQSAVVSIVLPNQVRVSVTEWPAVAVLQQGERSFYLSAQGRILGPAPEAGSLPIVQRPALASLRPGTAVVSPDLEALLIPLGAGFPGAYHLRVKAFTLDDRQNLSLRTDRGFVVYFGQMATADQRATLETKLAALKALSGRVDLLSAPIEYINLMNPSAPAVQLRR